MDVNSKSCRQQPIHPSQTGQDATSQIAMRRSGDQSSWVRPTRAARPRSCIEGRLKDEWLQTLNNLQTCPIQQQLPPYLQKNDTPWSVSSSLVASSQSSLECLYSGLESKESVQIKSGPSTQRAKVCSLAPVRFGWLPLRRHMVNNAAQQDGTVCKVKLKPPITPVLTCSSVSTNGSEAGDGTAGFGNRGTSTSISFQDDGKRKATVAERHQDTPLDQAIRTSHERFLWQMPVNSRGIVPQASHPTTAPGNSGTSSKHSGSISSITIRSRKVTRSSSLPDTSKSGYNRNSDPSPMALKNPITDPDYMNAVGSSLIIPQRKAFVVKITEQTSRFLQTGDENGRAYISPSSRTTNENEFSCLSTRASSEFTASGFSSMTHMESHSQVPSSLATQDTQMPVVLRRKATIIEVQEQRETVSRESENQRRKVAYRHSFSGFRVKDTKSQLHNEHMDSDSGSEMQVLSSKTKLYKSTISLQLTTANGPCLDNPDNSRVSKPRRPVSCYASLFSPVEPSVNVLQDAAVNSTISVLPQETNINPADSKENRFCSTERGGGGGGESHDKLYPRMENSAADKGQRKIEPALLRNQPLTLMKVPERSTHETHKAIVALNAAAIIANIKLQSEQKKITNTNGDTNGEKDSTSMSKTEELSGTSGVIFHKTDSQEQERPHLSNTCKNNSTIANICSGTTRKF